MSFWQPCLPVAIDKMLERLFIAEWLRIGPFVNGEVRIAYHE